MSKSGIAEAVNTKAPATAPDSTDTSPRWARALEQWRVTPIDDPVWDEVEGFIDALRTVTVEKVTERNRGREILRKDVEELCRDCASEMEYFEAQTSTWQADAIPWDKAEVVAARVGRLHEEIRRRRALQEERATRYLEMRRLRDQINAIEESISSQIAEISGTFASGDVSAEPAAGSSAVSSEGTPEVPFVTPALEDHTNGTAPSEAAGATVGSDPVTVVDEAWDLDEADEAHEDREAHIEAPASQNGAVFIDQSADTAAEAPSTATEQIETASAAASTTSVLDPRDAEDAAAAAEDAAQPRIIGGLHRVLDAATGRYSPLTKMQERAILAVGSGVGVVYASSAMGFEQLPDAVAVLAEDEMDGRSVFEVMPPAISEGQEVYDWLTSLANGWQDAKRITICQPVVVPIGDIAERVEGALRYCESRPQIPTRVLFFYSPSVVWSWLNLPEVKWQEIISRIRPIFALRPWSEDALRDRLQRHGFRSDSFVCSLALRATGGWTWCLDKLFELAAHENDVLAAVEQIERGLVAGGEFHDELFLRLGVRPDTVAEAVLNLVSVRGEMDIDSITPEVVGLDATPDECRAAVELLQTLSCFEPDNDVARLTPFMARVLHGEN